MCMKKYSALIFDLDGTVIPLSDDGSAITDGTRIAIAEAANQGVIVACATGREWEIAKPVVNALGLKSFCIIEGGTRIINPVTEKTVWQKQMPHNAASTVHEIFSRNYQDGLLIHSGDVRRIKISEAPVAADQLRFMYLLNVPAGIAEVIVNEINSHELCVVAHMTPSWVDQLYYDIHVTHNRATKEHAISEWLKLQKLNRAETIGMGDSGNDVPLFDGVGFKVAVGNATAQIKALADYIAPTVTERAIEDVLSKFFMGQHCECIGRAMPDSQWQFELGY